MYGFCFQSNIFFPQLQDDTKALESLTEEMITVGEDVKDIDQEKTASIETIVHCRQLVEWLRANVKGKFLQSLN